MNGIEPGIEGDLADSLRVLSDRRWPVAKAQAWAGSQPWLCGFNFLPSTAVNFVEMWRGATFDELTIDRELGWAEAIGFNTLRTNLPFVLWNTDRDAFLLRIKRFLRVASSHGLKTVFCLFDDCGFSGELPTPGPQPDPVPGVHNSRAVASPGAAMVSNPDVRPLLRLFVEGVLSTFRDDPRILFWDLYNEPGNLMVFEADGQRLRNDVLEESSLRLMIESFYWARNIGPIHPLTVGAWKMSMPWEMTGIAPFDNPIDRTALAISDLVSFHAYCRPHSLIGIIHKLSALGRPLMCTEWLARTIGSRLEEQLPIFNEHRIGAWQWGLVRGRTQTHIPWPPVRSAIPGYHEETSEWFHDLLHENGTPMSEEEVKLIGELTRD